MSHTHIVILISFLILLILSGVFFVIIDENKSSNSEGNRGLYGDLLPDTRDERSSTPNNSDTTGASDANKLPSRTDTTKTTDANTDSDCVSMPCATESEGEQKNQENEEKEIHYNGVGVDVVIDIPDKGYTGNSTDVLVVYPGTVEDDSKTIDAAKKLLENTKNTIERDDLLLVSVAYPQEELLLGDNIREAEAALLWVKNEASQDLGVNIDDVYLLGHSQGGYLVTRLNTMHKTSGVIANAPGPINIVFTCRLNERGTGDMPASKACALLKEEYGSVLQNPGPYAARSLINFSSGYKSDILFVQGMQDKKIQTVLWPKFKEKVSQCAACSDYSFLEIEEGGHGAAFSSPEAKQAIDEFLK